MAKPAPVVGMLFSLGHANTWYGEVIRVVGGHAALGSWDPQFSVALSTDSVAYPRWATSQIVWLIATDSVLEYKYVRDRRALGGGILWEDRIANRRVVLPHADSQPAVFLVTDSLWDCLGPQGAPTLVVQRPPEVSKVGKYSPEWTESCGDAVENPGGEDFFTPSWRAFAAEHESLHSRSSSQLLRRDSASRLDGDDSSSMARELSIISIGGLHKNSFSALECDGSEANDSPRMFRELSLCSLSLGMQKDGSRLLLPPSDSTEEVQKAACEGSTPSTVLPKEPSGSQSPSQEDCSPRGRAEEMSFEDAYVLIGDSPLGEGSFGLVWGCRPRCDSQGSEAIRAVKRITISKLLPRDLRNLFGYDDREGEIRMHEGLGHPHIIRLHEVFREPDMVSLVMECCRGGDLFDLIAQHRTGLPETSTAMVQRHLLEALAFLHERLIIHRDVKCENILMLEKEVPAEKNTFKLCDFGFAARLKSDSEMMSTRMGSPDNVAPEIVRGERYSTPVDCWAAGVIMYMTLSAKPPFWAKTDVEVLRRVRAGEYGLSGGVWDRVSDGAKDLVGRLMTFQSSARASAREALAHTWLSK